MDDEFSKSNITSSVIETGKVPSERRVIDSFKCDTYDTLSEKEVIMMVIAKKTKKKLIKEEKVTMRR